MNPVVVAPARKAGCATICARKDQIRRRPQHGVVTQRTGHAGDRRRAVGRVDDQLRQLRVVMDADLVAGGDPDIVADTGTGRRREEAQQSARRQETGRRILGVDPALDGVATQRDLILGKGQALARRDGKLQLDEVQSGHQFGHRVLDLQAGIHLQEAEVPGGIEQEFDRPGPDIADRPRRRDRRRAEPRPQSHIHGGRGRFLDDLLVATLDRALAFAQVDDVTVAVGKNLDLDVARVAQVAFQEDALVAERGQRLAPRRRQRPGELGRAFHHAHPTPAAARRRLDQHREADGRRPRRQFSGIAQPVVTRHQRHTRGGHQPLRRDLVTHRRDGRRGWPDPDQPRVDDGASKGGIFGEEAIAGVDRLGPAVARGGQQGRDVQVALAGRGRADRISLVSPRDVQRGAVGLGVDGDGPQPRLAAGGDHAHSDLATVGDQHRPEGSADQVARRAAHSRGVPLGLPCSVGRGFSACCKRVSSSSSNS